MVGRSSVVRQGSHGADGVTSNLSTSNKDALDRFVDHARYLDAWFEALDAVLRGQVVQTGEH